MKEKVQWYESEYQPVVGTSLLLEVEVTDSEDDQDQTEIKQEEPLSKSHSKIDLEEMKSRVTVIGKTTQQLNMRRMI